jgi:hypothetical protein
MGKITWRSSLSSRRGSGFLSTTATSAAGKAGGKARGGGSAIEGLREGRLGDVVIVDTGCKFTELSVFDIRGVGVVIWVEKESLGILKKEQRLFFTIFILGVVLVKCLNCRMNPKRFGVEFINIKRL